jgi:hypothetical protein
MKRLNAATIAQTVSAIDSDDMCSLYPTGSSHETSGAHGFVLVAVDSDAVVTVAGRATSRRRSCRVRSRHRRPRGGDARSGS